MSQPAKAMAGEHAMKRAKRRTDEMEASGKRVVDAANAISTTLSNRAERAATNPFYRIDDVIVNDEDSLVTSIENVIASASKKE